MAALHVAGRSLTLDAVSSEITELFSDVWLGTELWPAARALIDTLEKYKQDALQSSTLVLELGAGTGACGLAAAVLGARRVLLTDKESLLPTLQANVAANGLAEGRVQCDTLAWRAEGLHPTTLVDGADIILASDCLNPVYGNEHAAALAATIRDTLLRARNAREQHHASGSAGTEPEALLAQTSRGEEVAEAVFFDACKRLGLRVTLQRRVWVGHDGVVMRSVSCGSSADVGTSAGAATDEPPSEAAHRVAIYVITLGTSS